jgi:hypothetical protein
VIGLVLALALASPDADDAACRAAQELIYNGSTRTASQRLATLAHTAPHDPLVAYLEALALCWRIEEQPDSEALDAELLAKLDDAFALADRRLAQDPDELRAQLSRGAAFGVLSRYHFFRGQRSAAAKAAVDMRVQLARTHELHPESQDVLFGLGLYDYYAAVLPRIVRALHFLMGRPRGNRERGLERLEQARDRTLFHDTELRAQLFEIYAYYEDQPQRALEEVSWLRSRYPGAPLWALKTAEIQRELGLYGKSAELARQVITTAERGHPNYGKAAAARALASLARSLLLDLRLEEARAAALRLRDEFREESWSLPVAELLLGHCSELLGDRDTAEQHLRAAARGGTEQVRREARQALSSPVEAVRVRALHALAEGRRLREAGRWSQAALAYRRALTAWPLSQEALLGVATNLIRHGETQWAREVAGTIADAQITEPPWVRPWSHLLLGRVYDLAGERESARLEYKFVYEHSLGQDDLAELAERGLEQPYDPAAQLVPRAF